MQRRWVGVEVSGRVVRIKVAERGGAILSAAPEFEDCLRVATEVGRPVKAIQAEALQAWSGLVKKSARDEGHAHGRPAE